MRRLLSSGFTIATFDWCAQDVDSEHFSHAGCFEYNATKHCSGTDPFVHLLDASSRTIGKPYIDTKFAMEKQSLFNNLLNDSLVMGGTAKYGMVPQSLVSSSLDETSMRNANQPRQRVEISSQIFQW